MRFIVVILKNIMRRSTRSLLTIIGVAVGIGAVVALTGIAAGFERSWEEAYSARGTDMGVTKVTSQSPVASAFSASVGDRIKQIPGVADVAGVLGDLMSIEEAPGLLAYGWEPGSFIWAHLKLKEGRWPKPGEKELALGLAAAEMLNKKVGSHVQLEADEFTVTAVYQSSAMVENAAVIMPLSEMQRVTEREGKINFLNIKLTDNSSEELAASVQRQIKEQFPGFMAHTAGDLARSNTGMQLARAMSWATSMIALFVGAIGVMNTVSMSVFERFREIGVLLAIGWRRGRILGMILLESLALSLLGGVLGIGIGVVTVRFLETTAMMRGKLAAVVSPALCGTALLIALALGLLGGLYPAWRGSRLSPSSALRNE